MFWKLKERSFLKTSFDMGICLLIESFWDFDPRWESVLKVLGEKHWCFYVFLKFAHPIVMRIFKGTPPNATPSRGNKAVLRDIRPSFLSHDSWRPYRIREHRTGLFRWPSTVTLQSHPRYLLRGGRGTSQQWWFRWVSWWLIWLQKSMSTQTFKTEIELIDYWNSKATQFFKWMFGERPKKPS